MKETAAYRGEFRVRRQDSARVKAGLDKFREAMMNDARATRLRESGLPKDARDRLIK